LRWGIPLDIIDFHTHIFPDSLAERALKALKDNSPGSRNYTDGTASGLKESMVASGISRSVLLPIATKVTQVRQINQSAADFKDRCFIPFGTLHPDDPDFEQEIAFLVENGIKGIKFHPEYQSFYIDERRYYPIYETLAASGLVTLFHAGRDPGPFSNDHALPVAFRTIRSDFPDLKLVTAHLGGFTVWNEVPEVLCGIGIWFDTSAVCGLLDHKKAEHIIKSNGADHILFGSDSPWFDQHRIIEWVDNLDLTSSEKEKIFSQNAVRLLEL
jgi:predicted TIM-barrel fold metal-dependent hydrolase